MFQEISAKDKLSVRVARELERSILEKRFVPEQPIPSEARLCESFGVSRTVVREAIQQLKSQGILYSVPGSGNYITKNNVADLKRSLSLMAKLNEGTPLHLEMFHLREILEVDCVRSVCRSGDVSLLKAMKRFHREMKKCYNDLDAFGRADHAFHLEIMKASGNSLFCTILESLQDNFIKASMKVYGTKADLDRVCRDHQSIIEAIAARDESQAASVLTEHIRKSKEHI
ncbi:MAG: FadR/GntR family transcriptional regulator [Verrucomicrobiota bacterium]